MKIDNLKGEPKTTTKWHRWVPCDRYNGKESVLTPDFFPFFILTYNDTHFGAK